MRNCSQVNRRPRSGNPDCWMESNMLWTLFTILLVLWLFGLVASYTLGGFIHILLVLAVVVFAIRIMQGRRIA
jgi:Family of unknown function (DUF5670)